MCLCVNLAPRPCTVWPPLLRGRESGWLSWGVLTLRAGYTLVDEDKHQLYTNTVYSGRGVGNSCRIKTGMDQAMQSNFPAHPAGRAQGCSRPQLEEGECSGYEELQQKKEPPMCLPMEGGQTRWSLTAPSNPNHPVIFQTCQFPLPVLGINSLGILQLSS